MSIRLVENRVLSLLVRRVRVDEDKDAPVADHALGAGDVLLSSIFADTSTKIGIDKDGGELDALAHPNALEGTPNRLACVPLGDGSHHLTGFYCTASQREHCW